LNSTELLFKLTLHLCIILKANQFRTLVPVYKTKYLLEWQNSNHQFNFINTYGMLTLWRLAAFGDFQKKTHLNARGFVWEYLRSCMGYRPGWSVKRRSKSSSLHSKKNFCLGGAFFCVWRHKWRTFRPPWPGPGRQPLGVSISLKCLLETRLQSKSFDTLDDLLGFRVQKLW